MGLNSLPDSTSKGFGKHLGLVLKALGQQFQKNIIEQQHQTRLKPINAYDILMHCADAVLSGGIRRSATSLIFDKDDEEMMNSKTFFDVTRHTKFYHDDESDLYVGKITVGKKKYEVELS